MKRFEAAGAVAGLLNQFGKLKTVDLAENGIAGYPVERGENVRIIWS